MTGIVVALVVGAVAVFLWWRIEPLVVRGLATRERALLPPPITAPIEYTVERDKLPTTVVSIANQWNDVWAREAAMDAYCELYEATGSWDAVLTSAMADQARYIQRKGQLS